MKKIFPVANIIALLATIVISYLSVTGIFNGNTMATQSARYPTLFTPAPWAFSIWGLIYVALGCFVIFQARPNDESRALVGRIGPWFLLTCIANSAWVVLWMFDQAGLSVLVMIGLLFSLMKIVQRTDMELTDPPGRIVAFVWWPFSLYAGWITVALIANIAAWLVKVRWDGLDIAPEVWAIIMTLVAGVVYIYMTWARNMREYAFVGVWALVAVAVADRHRAPIVTIIAFIVAGLLFVSSSLHGYRNRAYGPFRKR